jgi:hypothetical protein
MSIRLITETTPACFGVMCPLHGDCRRYAAVESTQADPSTIGTCETSSGALPLFLLIERQAAITPPHTNEVPA